MDFHFLKTGKDRHNEDSTCQVFSIKQDYDQFIDLSKINALELTNDAEVSFEDDDDRLVYTCVNKECRIPCPCATCCTDVGQCSEHKIKHIEEDEDSISIRSTDKFCIDKSLLSRSYIMKYPGSPFKCPQCEKDVLHHNSYHLDFHENCKFCRQNRFKVFAETDKEFHVDTKRKLFENCLS